MKCTSEFEHGNVEDDDDKKFYTMNRTFYVSPEHIIYIIYGYVENFR